MLICATITGFVSPAAELNVSAFGPTYRIEFTSTVSKTPVVVSAAARASIALATYTKSFAVYREAASDEAISVLTKPISVVSAMCVSPYEIIALPKFKRLY